MQRVRLAVCGVSFVRIEEERTKKSSSSWLTRRIHFVLFSCLPISGYILFVITLISQILMFVRLCLFSFSSLLKPFSLMLLIVLVMIRIAPCLSFIFTGWQLSLGGVCFIRISVLFLLLQQFFFLSEKKKWAIKRRSNMYRRTLLFLFKQKAAVPGCAHWSAKNQHQESERKNRHGSGQCCGLLRASCPADLDVLSAMDWCQAVFPLTVLTMFLSLFPSLANIRVYLKGSQYVQLALWGENPCGQSSARLEFVNIFCLCEFCCKPNPSSEISISQSVIMVVCMYVSHRARTLTTLWANCDQAQLAVH